MREGRIADLPVEEGRRVRDYLRSVRRSSYSRVHPFVNKKIWRPVDVGTFLGALFKEPWEDLKIDPAWNPESGNPCKVFRCRIRHDGEWIAADVDSSGRVCFCYEVIPENWTYFEVVSVHRDETSLIVRPVVGSQKELLAQF